MKKRMIFAIAAATQFAIIPFVFAQEEEEEVFELSPFSVDSSSDSGYRATNTLSGTRFNSSLRDTSASVSVWTEEFLADTGLTEIDELIEYSLNTVLDTNDQDGAGGNFNVYTNATAVTQRIRTRGIESSRGIDYFKAITPDDSYKIGRYDDSRGPNGVLFGVSAAGGIINQTSIVANTQRDTGKIQLSFGTSERKRMTIRLNRVLMEDKLALTIAGVYQENGHWRDWVSNDKERIFGAMTWKVNDKITLRANYEDGWEHKTSLQQSTLTDKVLPWYDNMLAFGMDAVTFEPDRGGNAKKRIQGAQVTNATRAVGVTGRDGNPKNKQHRLTYIENDGTLFDATGTFVTGGYDVETVRHPDGSPGLGNRSIRINDPDFLPYYMNPGGPDFFRETDLSSHSLFADIQITDNWYFNIQAGHQRADIDVPQLQGSRPEFRADPNTTQGATLVDGEDAPLNPYVGQFYFDGDYRRDKNLSRYDEFRISTSYNLDTERLGNHRFAIAASEVKEEQLRGNTNLALGGNPAGKGNFLDNQGFRHTGSQYNHADNRISVRNYFDFNDRSTWTAGSWRNVPETIYTDAFTPGESVAYPLVWAENHPGNINYLIDQTTESMMAVSQSHFLNNHFVLTLGYREDAVGIDRAGHRRDPVIGWLPDFSIGPDTTPTEDIIPGSPQTNFDATVRTAGAVYHLSQNLSLVANTGSNIGIPDFRRTVFPDGATSPPPDGSGSDFGIDFTLFDNKINGRVVYYETESIQEVVGGSQLSGPMERIYQAYEDAFELEAEETGDETKLLAFLNRRQELRPEVNGKFRDNVSDGFELKLTANFTKNWRLTMNAAKTDRVVSNMFGKGMEFVGLQEAGDGRVIQGVVEAGVVPDPEGDEGDTIDAYTIDPSAYTSDGVISKFLALEGELPEGRDFNNTGIGFQIYEMADNVNDQREQLQKRWGLRPYRVNLFTAYDFKEGRLKGWTVGGGYRWQSANIIGEEDGEEFIGEPKVDADFMVRYKLKGGKFLGDGNWTFQMNVNNLFDNRTIIPSRLAINGDPNWQVPGDRGPAYARFDFPTPLAYRFTVTHDF